MILRENTDNNSLLLFSYYGFVRFESNTLQTLHNSEDGIQNSIAGKSFVCLDKNVYRIVQQILVNIQPDQIKYEGTDGAVAERLDAALRVGSSISSWNKYLPIYSLQIFLSISVFF